MTGAAGRLVLAVLVGVVAFVATTPAAGYCRKMTSSDSSETSDPASRGACDPAPASALPLYWATSCVEYRITVDPALETQGKMTTARASELVHRAAAAWGTVQCPSAAGGTRPVAIQTVDVAEGRCAGARGATRNEVRFTTLPSDGDTIAVTDMTFDAQNGGLFTAVTSVSDVYTELGSTPPEVDLQVGYVVRHELGHFLGLAHSERGDAVMNATFRSHATEGLADDDARGLCDVYSPDDPVGAGCSAATEAVGDRAFGGTTGLAVLAWLGLIRRRRAAARGFAGLVAALALLASTSGAAHAAGAAEKQKPKAAAKASISAPRRAPAKPNPTAKKPATSAPDEPTDEELVRLAPVTIPESPVAVPATPTTTAAASTVPEMQPTAAPPPNPRPAEPDVASPGTQRSDLYLGAAYRAFVLPRMLLDMVGRANKDPTFQAVSLEAAVRRESGFSLVPALTFADLSTGDMLVGARSADRASSFAYVRSDLAAVAASVQLVWAFPVSRRVELELGVELGIGVTFGRLVDNWVYETAEGPLAYGGRRFAPCRTVNDGPGCRPQDHASPTPLHVGNYTEPGMFAGGAAPTLLPWVSLPLLGVRARVTDDVALRVGVGASATGIWLGASLGYAVVRRTSS